MQEILGSLRGWFDAGQRFAVATVVRTFSSAPRGPGAVMAVSASGEVVGSVSGGCVEGAVYEVCQEVLASGVPQLVRYGVSDDAAFGVGLTCGGTIELLVEAVDRELFPQFGALADAVGHGVAASVVTRLDAAGLGARIVFLPAGSAGSLGDAALDAHVADDAAHMLAQDRTEVRHYGRHGERVDDEVPLFVRSFATPPRMIVLGAVDFASAMARMGRYLGYHVTVCDARPVFATRARFPEADELVVDWPHRYFQNQLDRGLLDARTVVCVLTHDAKFDVPLLEIALRAPVAYVGAMGSRRTDADRRRQLADRGVTEELLRRLSSPIGLDLGARTPEETAVSIAAEIIAARFGGSGERLSRTGRAIHLARAGVG